MFMAPSFHASTWCVINELQIYLNMWGSSSIKLGFDLCMAIVNNWIFLGALMCFFDVLMC
jgi:hypothetical protein